MEEEKLYPFTPQGLRDHQNDDIICSSIIDDINKRVACVAEEYTAILRQYFGVRQWYYAQCTGCGLHFMFKKKRQYCRDLACNSSPCFLNLSKKNKKTVLSEIAEMCSHFFYEKGYTIQPAISPLMHKWTTLFATAGVQVMGDMLFDELPVINNKLYVAQPVIRMQYIDDVMQHEGFSTSFVNMCTEQIDVSYIDHLKNIDKWIDYLSALGLHANDVTMVIKDSINNWGKGKFSANSITFLYGGIEIGEAMFSNRFPQKTRADISFSDIGFGLERISWILNKNFSYFKDIGPYRLNMAGKKQLMDAVRTMTLMAASGVEPGNKAHGYRLRMLSKKIACDTDYLSLEELTAYYYRYWVKFFPFKVGLTECQRILRVEYDRNVNKFIADKNGIIFKPDLTTDDFLESIETKPTIEKKHLLNCKL